MPRDSKQGKVIGRDGEFSQCNRSPMDHSSLMLIMSCYTGFFNVRRGWQSLNTGPRFYLFYLSEGQVGCQFIHPAQPKDALQAEEALGPISIPRGWPLLEDQCLQDGETWYLFYPWHTLWEGVHIYILLGGQGYGVECHFQQYFSYIVQVSFIGGENHRLTSSH